MKKHDIILLAALLLFALAALGGISLYSCLTTNEPEAVVYLEGEEKGRYPLAEDTTKEIRKEDGSYNLLRIRDGKAEITEASCPDKVCVRHRPVDKQGESLVCLPNKVVVEIENAAPSAVDGSTR